MVKDTFCPFTNTNCHSDCEFFNHNENKCNIIHTLLKINSNLEYVHSNIEEMGINLVALRKDK